MLLDSEPNYDNTKNPEQIDYHQGRFQLLIFAFAFIAQNLSLKVLIFRFH